MSSEKAKETNAGKNAFSFISKMSTRSKLIVIAAIAITFTFAFPIISMVSGRNFGSIVGTAVGSLHAVTEDMPAAYSQGVEDGLSATDIRASNENMLREVGKLDVLAANALLTDTHKYGDTYAALYSFGADVIFSVDVSKAQVFASEDHVIVRVPSPVAVINIDSTKTRLEAEWSRVFFDGSTERGIDAYLNSMKEIQSDARTALKEYDDLERKATLSAEKQIKMLYESISGKPNVEVIFEGTAGDNNE